MNDSTVNLLGEKNGDPHYSCKVCNQSASQDEVISEEWFFKIKSNTEQDQFSEDQVEYLCPEHHRVVPAIEASEYVKVGYPYFLSKEIKDNSIITF